MVQQRILFSSTQSSWCFDSKLEVSHHGQMDQQQTWAGGKGHSTEGNAQQAEEQ